MVDEGSFCESVGAAEFTEFALWKSVVAPILLYVFVYICPKEKGSNPNLVYTFLYKIYIFVWIHSLYRNNFVWIHCLYTQNFVWIPAGS